jgi:hypothetical protein
MGGQKIHFFQILGILRVNVNESRDSAYIMKEAVEAVNSNHNICKKSGFTIWLCNLFRTKVSKKSKLSNNLRKISSPMYLLLAIYSALALI